jgi:hypothetical protein
LMRFTESSIKLAECSTSFRRSSINH